MTRHLICGKKIELASKLESEDIVDWGRKWLVNLNTGKTHLVSFDWSNFGAIDMKIKMGLFLRKNCFQKEIINLSYSTVTFLEGAHRSSSISKTQNIFWSILGSTYWLLQSIWKNSARNFCLLVYLWSYSSKSKSLFLETVQSSCNTSCLRTSQNFGILKTPWCSAWLSLLHNLIQLSLNSGSVQVQSLLAACWRFAMVRISDNGPGWK